MPKYLVCAEPGCPSFTEGHTRCDDCRSAYERARGTSKQRGYGTDHRKARAALLAEGHTHCAHCGQPFTADNPMEAGHAVAQRDGGTVADGYAPHCMRCNRGWRATRI